MKLIFYFVFLSFYSGLCFSQIHICGKVNIIENGILKPLSNANIGFYNLADTLNLIKGTSTSADGSFKINITPDDYRLSVSFVGYQAYQMDLHLSTSSKDTVLLNEILLKEDSHLLSEIIVGGSRMKQDVEKKTITFTIEQIRKAKDGRDLILNLPYLILDKVGNTLTTLNGNGILLLINGVKSNDSEVKLLKADKIKKVEYYDVPSIKYNEAACVINIITSDFDSGWAADLYGMSSQFYSMFTPYLSYVNGRHKFTIGYDFFLTPKRSVKDYYEEKYTYSLQNINYEYAGQKEDQNWGNQQSANFSYSNYKNDNYVFQVKSIIGFTKEQFNETRNVRYLTDKILDLKTGFLLNKIKRRSYNIDLYYSKVLNNKDEFSVNILSSYIGNNQYLYSEEHGSYPFQVQSNMDIFKKTLIGELGYSRKIRENKFAFGYRTSNSWANNNIENPKEQVSKKSSRIFLGEHYLYGEVSGQLKVASYRFSLGGKLNLSKTASGTHKDFSFLPTVILGKAINDFNFLRLTYQLSTEVSPIQQFSDYSIMVMQNILRKGNPDLKTSTSQHLRLSNSYSSKLLNAEISIFYRNTKNYIFNFFDTEMKDQKMYITLSSANANKNRMYGGEADVFLKPFKGFKLGCDFSFYKQYFKAKPNSSEFKHYFYPISIYASFQYKKIAFDYYQKLTGSLLDGLYLSGIEKVSYISAGYSYKNIDFQLLFYFPFVRNTFKSYTIDQSIVKHEYSKWLKTKDKSLGLSLTWRFNTYLKNYRADRNTYNSDTDSGVFNIK